MGTGMPKNHVHSANVRSKKGTDKVEVYCEDPDCDWTVDYDPELVTHRGTFGDAVKKLLAPKKAP